jgi:hypothetical protein
MMRCEAPVSWNLATETGVSALNRRHRSTDHQPTERQGNADMSLTLNPRSVRIAIAMAITALAILAAVAYAGSTTVLPVEPDGGIGGVVVLPVEPDGGIGN